MTSTDSRHAYFNIQILTFVLRFLPPWLKPLSTVQWHVHRHTRHIHVVKLELQQLKLHAEALDPVPFFLTLLVVWVGCWWKKMEAPPPPPVHAQPSLFVFFLPSFPRIIIYLLLLMHCISKFEQKLQLGSWKWLGNLLHQQKRYNGSPIILFPSSSFFCHLQGYAITILLEYHTNLFFFSFFTYMYISIYLYSY